MHIFKKQFKLALSTAIIIFLSLAFAKANDLEMVTSKGKIIIELDEANAPKHAERLRALASEKFYDGIIFHRVIDGFMAQTGDPTGTGMSGSELPDLKAEFSSRSFKRGVLGMARSGHPDSANSQFFIMYADGSWLNGQYTVIGEVVEGMDIVDMINKGEPPANPDKIISMSVLK